ncbi:MAG: Hsp20/alpha crystallin family protein [Candidatus Tectimicrobiota bacterium]
MTVPAPQTVPVQLHQAEQRLVLAAPMPGLAPQDITVTIHSDRVIIDGVYRGSRQGQPELLVSEWTVGPYYRDMPLPQPVNGALTHATYGNGVLVLSMPTLEAGQQAESREFRLEVQSHSLEQHAQPAASHRRPTQAQRALMALQSARVERPSANDRTPGEGTWVTIVQAAEGYDEEATAEVDPSHTSATAVFADGSRLWWNMALNLWETGPAPASVHLPGASAVRADEGIGAEPL